MSIVETEIALWPRGSQAEGYFDKLLERYHQEGRGMRVKPHWMDAKNPWADVSRTMINRSGYDITELGVSWVESLVATNCLRPFSPKEFHSFGGPEAFIMPGWKSKKADAGDSVYSIPYMADARHIYYRRDLLEQAGVDEATAFNTPNSILQTLESLKLAGVKHPFLAPIVSERMNLSFIASWVWGVGADFINSAGSRATFDEPGAIAGIADYFRAANYIAPEFRQLDVPETDREFCRGNAAVTLSGSWLYHVLQQVPEFAAVRDNLGLALPVGQASCGGTHLVIWQHSLREEAAFDFIHFLTDPQVQADLSAVNFVLPARLAASQVSPHASDPNYQVLVQTIISGRSYGASPFWNILEDRLSRLLVQIWPEYFETCPADANAFLSARLGPLARRINITLEE